MPNIKGILDADERVHTKAKISKSAVLVCWFSIPFVFFATFLFVYLPKLIKGKIEDKIKEKTGLGGIEELNPFKIIKDEMISSALTVYLPIITVTLILFIVVWLCFSLYLTHRHFQYELAITTYDVIARAGKKIVRIPLRAVSNIYLETSLWGKIFRYGTITIVSSRYSISIKNVAQAKQFSKTLATLTIEDENHFLNL